MVKREQENITTKMNVQVDPKQNGHALENGGVGRPASPPDGGLNAWLVVLASFLCNGIIFGVINSVGVLFKEIHSKLVESNADDAAAKASLVGSLAIGSTFFMSAIAGIMTDAWGIRTTALIGALLAGGGTFASSFFFDSVGALYFTFGIMFGVGASLVYTPSLVILGHYFDNYLGVVNGLVTSGSSVFTLAMPFVLQAMINNTGLDGCFLMLTALVSVMIGCAVIFKPIKHQVPINRRKTPIVNTALFKSRRYVVWTIGMATSLLGYFVPYTYTVNFVKDNYGDDHNGNILIFCVALMSLFSRLICGKLADLPKVNVVVFQQVAFGVLGILTILMAAVHNWILVIAIALTMGICDGCSITMIGPIAFELCGKEGASQALGFVLGLCSIPMTIGPFVAGYIYDQTNSYTIPYFLSGGLTLAGAIIMCPMHCLRQDSVSDVVLSPPEAVEFDVIKPLYPDPHTIDTRPLPPSYKEAVAVRLGNGLSNGNHHEIPS